jgi:pimeloyl-ACP methyl ester carboxylesterase
VTTFVVAHGAWSSAWAWKKMRPLLRGAGHELWTPTYTGLGERAHLASPAVDLDTHIADVIGVLDMEDLRDIVLIGHSYGGMVATGVMDRARDRIAQVVYLDAFVPRDGQCLLDLQAAEVRDRMRELARTSGEGWRLPPNPMPPDTPEADVPGQPAADCRSRSRPSRHRCALRPGRHLHRAATSIASASDRPTSFASSPNARNAKAAGAISRSTPATTRTSPRRRRCWRCWNGSWRRRVGKGACRGGDVMRDVARRATRSASRLRRPRGHGARDRARGEAIDCSACAHSPSKTGVRTP